MNDAENIYSIRGIEKVFLFTVRQTFKNRGYLLSFILFVLVFTLMGPIQYASSQAGRGAAEKSMSKDVEISDVENVFVCDQTGILDESVSDLGSVDGNVSFVSDESVVSDSLGKNDIVIVIKTNETGFIINGIISDSSDISNDTLDVVTSELQSIFDDTRMKKSGISESDIELIYSGVSVDDPVKESDLYVNKDGGKGKENKIQSGSYGLYMLGFAMVVFIVISMSSSYIITSVTEEKQSKLVETLLVSVRPMALLMGKVVGMMSYVVLVIICGAIGSTLSSYLMERFLGIDKSNYGGSSYDFSIFTSFGIVNTLFLVLSILLAFLLFGMVSGLFGSTCNKTEDIQVATGNVMTVAMVGYFSAMVIGFMDNDTVNLLAALIPPFSFFTAPVAFLGGRISGVILAVAYVIQLVVIVIVLRVSAKVYRLLLLNGNTVPGIKSVLESVKGA